MTAFLPTRRRAAIRILSALLLALLCRVTQALERAPLVVDGRNNAGYEIQAAQVLMDESGALSIADVAGSEAHRFRPASRAPLNFGFSTAAIWIRFTIQNAAAVDSRWFLEAGLPVIDDLRLYTSAPDGLWHETRLGRARPFSERPFPTRNFVFPIELRGGRPADLYLRVASESAITVPLVLYSPQAFAVASTRQADLHGLLYGMLAIMIIYHLFLYQAVRDTTHLYYAAFASGCLLMMASFQGYGTQYLWSEPTLWSRRSVLFFLAFFPAAGTAFFRRFLQTPTAAPRADRIYRTVQWTLVLFLPLTLLLPYRLVSPPLILLGAFCNVLSLVASITGLLRGYRAARHYVAAWLLFFVAVIVRVLEVFGTIPVVLGEDGILAGMVAAMALSAFAVADRINLIRLEKERAEAQARDARQQATLRLEQLVDERTRELRRSKEEAERANRIKDDFLATISHEMRTPLTALLGSATLLKGAPMDAETERRVDLIGSSGRHLLGLIDEMLDLARIEAGKLTLAPIRFEVAAVVGAVIDQLEAAAKVKGIELSYRIDDTVSAFVADEQRVRQVLLNLVGNAIKFTPQGSVRVDVEALATGRREPAGLLFRVTDTGIGIAPQALSMLFQPFSQVDASLARRHGGSGLGLAISKRLVEAMGGSMGVESAPGRGSEFWFVLPLAAHEGEGAVAPDGGGVHSRPLRLLLVEDVPESATVVRALLERSGHTVTVADSGHAALAALAAAQFDLVLMDLQMPGMDGFEATRRIRALPDPDRAATPVFALTANVQGQTVDRCLAAGFEQLIAKPVDIERLNARLAARFGGAPSAAPSGARAAERSAQNGPLDLPLLRRHLAAMGRDELAATVASYCENTRSRVEQLRSARAQADRPAVIRSAHALVGSSGALGALRAAGLAAEIERLAADGDLTAIDAPMQALAAEIAAALPALTGFVQTEPTHFAPASPASLH